MTTPAREPFRLVPPAADVALGPADTRLVVWGDYPAMRAGIRALLAEMDLDAADAAPDEVSASPVIVVADAGDRDVAAMVEELTERFGEGSTLIVLAGEAGDFEGLRPGPGTPAGLLLRDVSAEELAAAVQAVSKGLTVLDPEVAAVIARGARSAPVQPLDEPLTERELDVLRELALGLPNKTIALRLGISEHTVKYHVGEILGKMEAASRTEAVMLAARRGLLPL